MPSAWQMAGTEGTGEYFVVIHTYLGRVGYRKLETSYRLRVEPEPAGRAELSRILTRLNGWKQPDLGHERYSTVVSKEEFPNALGIAIRALDSTRAELNPSTPVWIREIVEQARTRTGIFISYRRAESQRDVKRMYDRLSSHFLRSTVFVDLDSIPLGKPFSEVLQEALDKTTVGLVVIGPLWVSMTNADGTRRLDDPGDFVRLEVSALLTMGIPVVPCLVSGAQLPEHPELPVPLRPLLSRQGVSLRPDPNFQHDLDGLLERLTRYAA